MSIKTNFPPYQSKTPITNIPRNSLRGAAIFCRFTKLFEYLKNFELDLRNFLVKKVSETKALITLIPLKISSVIDVYSPCSFWTIKDLLLNVLPM